MLHLEEMGCILTTLTVSSSGLQTASMATYKPGFRLWALGFRLATQRSLLRSTDQQRVLAWLSRLSNQARVRCWGPAPGMDARAAWKWASVEMAS